MYPDASDARNHLPQPPGNKAIKLVDETRKLKRSYPRRLAAPNKAADDKALHPARLNDWTYVIKLKCTAERNKETTPCDQTVNCGFNQYEEATLTT